MESKRQKQVAETIRRHFSTVLQQEGGYIYGVQPMVTVTSVKVSPDMGQAKIYLSIYNVENKGEVVAQMESQNRMLRQALANRVKKHMRRVPALSFYEDETLDEMYRLNELFKKIDSEEKPSTTNRK